MSKPLVTVYITTYNRFELLKRAVESVLEQSYSNIELLVADDGSDDSTPKYLEDMEKKGFLTAIINKGDSKGACFGRNKAIQIANGVFITGLDDDDYFKPLRIENFMTFWIQLESHNSIAGLFDSVIEIRPDGSHKYNETLKASNDLLRKKNIVGNQVFVPLQNIKDISGFDEKMPALQDWDTWLRLTHKFGQLININTYSYVVDQVHEGERISTKKAIKVRAAFLRLRDKLQPISHSESISILDSMYRYQQMNIIWTELFILFYGLKFRTITQVLKRRFLR
jgi:glycosyltransferase involved in cell wall biosynthesis